MTIDTKLETIERRDDLFFKATGTLPRDCMKIRDTPIGKGPKEEIGLYGGNNGTLAYVDENGDYYVGECIREAIDALEKAGYVNGYIYVPHSNDSGWWLRDQIRGRTEYMESVEKYRQSEHYKKTQQIFKPQSPLLVLADGATVVRETIGGTEIVGYDTYWGISCMR